MELEKAFQGLILSKIAEGKNPHTSIFTGME